jgi:uncharacterized iron-regulated membrane protein
MSLRTVFFWCHLTCALAAGVVIFIMSATGVLLMYEKQMLAWSDELALPPAAAAGTRLTAETLLQNVRRAYPDLAVTQLTIRSGPAPASVSAAGGRTLLVDSSTGAIIGDASPRLRAFFRRVTEWHRYLALGGQARASGKAITGAANLVFLFIACSGVVLWWPRVWTRRALAAVTIAKWRHASGRARDFNWHNALGFWSAVPLVVVVASATVISYPWASDLAYRVAGEAPPPRPAAPATAASKPAATPLAAGTLDRLWQQAETRVGDWRAISVRLPLSTDGPAVFTIDSGSGGEPHKRATLALHVTTGAIVRWEPFESLSAGRQLRSVLRFAHTGEVAGIAGQTVAGLASAGACVLVVTGFALTWRRFTMWRRRSAVEPLRKAA